MAAVILENLHADEAILVYVRMVDRFRRFYGRCIAGIEGRSTYFELVNGWTVFAFSLSPVNGDSEVEHVP